METPTSTLDLVFDRAEVTSSTKPARKRSRGGKAGENYLKPPPQPVSSKIASALGVGGGPEPPSAATPASAPGEVSVGACLSPRKPRGSSAFFRYSPLLMKRGNRPKNLSGGAGGAGNQSSGEGETAAELGKMSMQGGYQGGEQVRRVVTFTF